MNANIHAGERKGKIFFVLKKKNKIKGKRVHCNNRVLPQV